MAESAATRAPSRGESVTELMPFMNFLVHSYTCCSDKHASPYWTFIRRWISMSFTPSLLKKRMPDPVLLWCMLQAGPPSLHYYCSVVLHSCIVLSHVGRSSNHEYNCCQLKRQSSYVSNFYRTLKVFIWLSLVCTVFVNVQNNESNSVLNDRKRWHVRVFSLSPPCPQKLVN